MTRAEKIQFLKDVKEKKVPRKNLDCSLLTDGDLDRMMVILRNQCNKGIVPSIEELAFMGKLYAAQGLNYNHHS